MGVGVTVAVNVTLVPNVGVVLEEVSEVVVVIVGIVTIAMLLLPGNEPLTPA